MQASVLRRTLSPICQGSGRPLAALLSSVDTLHLSATRTRSKHLNVCRLMAVDTPSVHAALKKHDQLQMIS